MLEVKNLEISFKNSHPLVQQVSFSVEKNKTLGIVGESGSGKSISSLAILGLLPKTATVKGDLFFNQQPLLGYNEQDYQKIRGNEIAMIFQEPMSSLNPTLTCGFQVAEMLQQHTQLSNQEIKEEVISLFSKVKLPRPEAIYISSSFWHNGLTFI